MKTPMQKIIQFLRIFAIGILSAIFIVIAFFFYEHSSHPWAVRDPLSPRFKAENFRFEDYPNGCEKPEMKAVVAAIFPKGTPESYLDEILIDHAGADSRGIENGTKVYGRNGFTNLSGWIIAVDMDENKKAKGLRCSGVTIY